MRDRQWGEKYLGPGQKEQLSLQLWKLQASGYDIIETEMCILHADRYTF
jgi:hypothetical protein